MSRMKACFLLSLFALAIHTSATGATTLHVSPLGDNSDGSTWAKAFHTIQAALSAVPDDKGNHRVIVRPGTYFEANLFPKHRGAKDAYNVLLGDVDGKLGSGSAGWVVIDGSCPGVAVRQKTGPGNPDFQIVKSAEPETGFKSVDWWCTFQSKPSGSGVVWDRWKFKGLYVTGTDAGFVWDMVREDGAPFSTVVEDCVGVGRFAGAGVIAHTSRADEPVMFRRSQFLNLDVWGDAGAAYVRVHNRKMSDVPDVVFEDCTLTSPDNALQCSFAGAPQRYSRVAFKRSCLFVLNFSQPQGTPSSGIICCDATPETLRVDFEDTLLAGYAAFGTSRPDLNKTRGQGGGNAGRASDAPIAFTLKGEVRAYVHYRQPVPKGMRRLEAWPVEAFAAAATPSGAGARGGSR
jgi:hypothetical protein